MKRDLDDFRRCSVAEALNHADGDSDDEFFFAALGFSRHDAEHAAPPEVLRLQPLVPRQGLASTSAAAASPPPVLRLPPSPPPPCSPTASSTHDFSSAHMHIAVERSLADEALRAAQDVELLRDLGVHEEQQRQRREKVCAA